MKIHEQRKKLQRLKPVLLQLAQFVDECEFSDLPDPTIVEVFHALRPVRTSAAEALQKLVKILRPNSTKSIGVNP